MANIKTITSYIFMTLLAAKATSTPFTYNTANDVYSGIVNGIPTANDENDGSPDLHDAVNNILGTNYISNADLDDRFVSADHFFSGNGSYSIALIGLTASKNNTVGLYQHTTKVELLSYDSFFGITGDGSAANPYPGSVFDVSGTFGWYIENSGLYSIDTYYSEPNLNNGGWDHMMTFKIPELHGQIRFLEVNGQVQEYSFDNAFLLGFEDLPYGYGQKGTLGDDDYDDMIILVNSTPISVSTPCIVTLMYIALLDLFRRIKVKPLTHRDDTKTLEI